MTNYRTKIQNKKKEKKNYKQKNNKKNLFKEKRP